MMAYDLESPFVRDLDNALMAFLDRGLRHQDETTFSAIALKEFELQFHTVAPYREFCEKKGITPERLRDWSRIPAVPSMAFKKFVLTTFPPHLAVQSYMSSGTTDPTSKARVYRDKRAVEIMVKANALLTRELLFPDRERMKILFLAPSPEIVPSMGMAVGLGQVRKLFGTEESAFLITMRGLNLKLLLQALEMAKETKEPIALIGATSAFIFFFAACEKEGIRFMLPEGSRVCDGGGYQGQFGECTKEEFWQKCARILGVEEPFCVNVLGTAETSTNYFDNALKNHIEGGRRVRYKELPPWTRLSIIDPESLEPVAPGEMGLLCHYDVTNRAMMFAVQTDNVGVAVEDGFEILGRWRKKGKEVIIDRSFAHPGGKMAGILTNFLLRHKLSSIGRVYSKLTT
jgi:hypothetical protein